jgi:5-methylcytosine-specific restriction endonuclease McrA
MKLFKRKQLSKDLRKKIFERDNYECQLCYTNLIDKKDLRVIDHKIPLSKGGSNSISNLWLLCNDCDKRKKNKLFPELMKQYIKGKLNYLSNLRFNGNRYNK